MGGGVKFLGIRFSEGKLSCGRNNFVGGVTFLALLKKNGVKGFLRVAKQCSGLRFVQWLNILGHRILRGLG